jgi:hypothetical protein
MEISFTGRIKELKSFDAKIVLSFKNKYKNRLNLYNYNITKNAFIHIRKAFSAFPFNLA